MLEQQFSEIWLVDFEFVAPDGEQQRPVCMVAEEFWSGRQIRMWEEELRASPAAPFNTGPDCLLVAYFASAELACFRALGWPLPYNILDLFAEHRVITNGLTSTWMKRDGGQTRHSARANVSDTWSSRFSRGAVR